MDSTVLVVLDMPLAAEHGLPLVARFAKATDARLLLTCTGAVEEVSQSAGIGTASSKAVELLADSARLPAEQGVRPAGRMPAPQPVADILRDIQTRGIRLVVLYTHQRPSLGHWPHETPAGAILAHSPVPVLVIQAHAGPAPTVKREHVLLVPLDGSARAECALPQAVVWSRALAAEIALLRVVPPMPLYPESMVADAGVEREYMTTEMARAQEYLAAVAARLVTNGLSVRTTVRYGWPVQMIVSEEEAKRAELVVMATHGYSGWRRLLFGSVASDVLQRGTLPLLLVRPVDLHPKISLTSRGCDG
jgi:nucleotide-binding universal stress UspA family protein